LSWTPNIELEVETPRAETGTSVEQVRQPLRRLESSDEAKAKWVSGARRPRPGYTSQVNAKGDMAHRSGHMALVSIGHEL
jgi:hypothetical protein